MTYFTLRSLSNEIVDMIMILGECQSNYAQAATYCILDVFDIDDAQLMSLFKILPVESEMDGYTVNVVVMSVVKMTIVSKLFLLSSI